MIGALYYGIFIAFKTVNDKDSIINIKKPVSERKYVKVEVPEVENLPFDFVMDEKDLKRKPFKPIKISGLGLFLMKPVAGVGKKYLDKVIDKSNKFDIDVEDTEIKIKKYENHDPEFDSYEDFLYDNLDEN